MTTPPSTSDMHDAAATPGMGYSSAAMPGTARGNPFGLMGVGLVGAAGSLLALIGLTFSTPASTATTTLPTKHPITKSAPVPDNEMPLKAAAGIAGLVFL